MIQQFLTSALAYCIISTPIYLLVRFALNKFKKRKWVASHEITMLLFFEYMVVLLSQTIIPKWHFIRGGGIEIYRGFFDHKYIINLIPLKTISGYIANLGLMEATIVNVFANILIFIPFGIFLPLIWHKIRTFPKIFLISSILIIAIETIQFFIGRSADIDDYILNILGAILGFYIWKFCTRRSEK